MDDVETPEVREQALLGLLALFFVSGATALTYQTLWVGELELVFGTSTFAIATVLAAFMGGLAIGGFVAGRYADQVLRPLRWYGILEIGIGIYAALFQVLLTVVTPLYLSLWRALEPGPVGYALVQFGLVGAVLVLPTAMMGATLPLLARFATRNLAHAGTSVGTLYAVNTAGAVFGTFLCGFVLLPWIGRFDATMLAAGANLALGIAAIGLDQWVHGARDPAPAEEDPHAAEPAAAALPVVTAAIALAGFSALVYEVAWTRLLGLMLGASTYTFSVMLLAFLVGIAIGGRIGGTVADYWMRSGIRTVLLGFAAIEVGIAVVSYALMYLYPELPFWYVRIFDVLDGVENPRAAWIVSLVIAGLIMTPPAVLMGMHFPVAVRAAIGRSDALGGPVGWIYGANTLGGVLGAFMAGFLLLPTIGLQWTILVAGAVELLAATALVVYAERNARPPGAAGAGTGRMLLFTGPLACVALVFVFLSLRPPWDPMLMTAGMYHYVSHFSDHSREGILDYSVAQYDLVFYEEGLSSVVTVAVNRDSGNMWLANNGKVDASTTTDMPTQVLCSLLPLQFAPSLDNVMIIGLASGVTAGAVTLVPDVKHLDVIELEPAIRRAALHFGEFNHDVLRDPRLTLIHNDGRNHVLLTPEATYDVIVSEPSNPWITGVSNLFTKEFFELGKSRLKPGGVWSQWVQMYGMDTRDLRTLLRTFAEVYPNVIVYATIEDADLVLIGSDAPLVPSLENAQKLFAWPKVVEELAEVPIDSPMDVVALYQMDRDAVLKMAGNIRLNTDDNMAIEYAAPLNLHLETSGPNLELLQQHAQIPRDGIAHESPVWAELARSYEERGDTVRAIATMAVAAAMLPEWDPNRIDLMDEARAWQAALEKEAAELEGDNG